MAIENIKTAPEIITEFLNTQADDKSLDLDTMAAIHTLRDNGDLSKVKLLRKLEEARKVALANNMASEEETNND